MPNVLITHTDATTVTYTGYFCGISNKQADTWKLSIVPADSTQPALSVDLRSGDTYQTVGALPPVATYLNPAVIGNDALPPGTVDTVT